MEYNKYEIIAKERGYTITPEGVVFNPKGKQIGTYGKNKYMYFSFRLNGKIVKVYFHRYQAYLKFGNSLYEDGVYPDDERRRKVYEYALLPLGFKIMKDKYKTLIYKL